MILITNSDKGLGLQLSVYSAL